MKYNIPIAKTNRNEEIPSTAKNANIEPTISFSITSIGKGFSITIRVGASGIISVIEKEGVLEYSVRFSKISRAAIDADKVLRSIILIISL